MQQQSPTVNKSSDLPESGSIKSLKEGKQTADLILGVMVIFLLANLT
jgi:hypothetical protein